MSHFHASVGYRSFNVALIFLWLLLCSRPCIAVEANASTEGELKQGLQEPSVDIIFLQRHIPHATIMAVPPNTNKAVVGDCESAPDTVSSGVQRLPKQCLISFNSSRGFVIPESSALWLTNLVVMNAGPGSSRSSGASTNNNSPPSSRRLLQAQGPPSSPGGNSSLVGTGASKAPIQNATTSGGGVYMRAGNAAIKGSALYANRVLFFNNTARNGGAVGMNDFARAEFIECTFDKNFASGHGGVLLVGDSAKANVTKSTILSNSAQVGDVAYVVSSSVLQLDAACGSGGACITNETVLTIADDPANLPEVYSSAAAFPNPQSAALWQQDDEEEFAAMLAARLSPPAPPSQPTGSLQTQESAAQGAPASSPAPVDDRSVWQRHKAVFITLIVVSAVCLVAILFFLYKLRGLTPRQDFGVLYPPNAEASSHASLNNPNQMPPPVVSTFSERSPSARSGSLKQQQDRGPSVVLMAPTSARAKDTESDMPPAAAPASSERSDAGNSASSARARRDDGTGELMRQRSSASRLSQGSKSRNSSSRSLDSEIEMSAQATPASFGAAHAAVSSTSPSIQGAYSAYPSSGRSAKSPASSNNNTRDKDELIGSPGGDDSLMSNQSLLDLNNEDPFKAGADTVRATPPHSSPCVASPLSHSSDRRSSRDAATPEVFWNNLEQQPQQATSPPSSTSHTPPLAQPSTEAHAESEAPAHDSLDTSPPQPTNTTATEAPSEDDTSHPTRRKWARRNLLEKSRRPQATVHSESVAPDTSEGHKEAPDPPPRRDSEPSGSAPSAAAPTPLSAEAAMLGQVERMPEDLDTPVVANPFSKSGAGGGGGKMRPSSFYTANEVKQSKRNRKLMEKRGMLNRGETPSAQLFAISEQAEIRYTNNGLLYEVPADEQDPTPHADPRKD